MIESSLPGQRGKMMLHITPHPMREDGANHLSDGIIFQAMRKDTATNHLALADKERW